VDFDEARRFFVWAEQLMTMLHKEPGSTNKLLEFSGSQDDLVEEIAGRLLDGVAFIAGNLSERPAVNIDQCAIKAEVLVSYLEDSDDMSGRLARSLCQDIIAISANR
jgi:hypothetical protein